MPYYDYKNDEFGSEEDSDFNNSKYKRYGANKKNLQSNNLGLRIRNKITDNNYTIQTRYERYVDLYPELISNLNRQLCEEVVYDELSRIVLDTCEHINEEEVRLSVLKDTIRKRKVIATLPVQILHDILTEVVRSQAVNIGRTVVRNQVGMCIDEHKVDSLIEEFLRLRLPQLAEDVLYEETIESQSSIVIDEIVKEEILAISEDIIKDMSVVNKRNSTLQFENKYRNELFEHFALPDLIKRMSELLDPLTTNIMADQPFFELSLDILLDQYLMMNNNSSLTLDNDPIRRLHKNMFMDSSLDVLLKELNGHLENDMQDLDEHELLLSTH